MRSHRQNATPMEPRGGACRLRHRDRPRHADLLDPDAAYDAHRGRRHSRHAGSRPAGRRARCRRRLRPEDVGRGRIRLLVWLARKHRTSFAWTEDRRENLIACFHSRDQYVHARRRVRRGRQADRARRRCARQYRRLFLLSDHLRGRAADGDGRDAGAVRLARIRCQARGVVTNTCPMAPYRGVSRPVITFSLERLMDKAAAAFGIDPIEIRRRNLIDKFPYTSATGPRVRRSVLSSKPWRWRCKAHRRARVPRAAGSEAREQGRYLGIGFATFSERTGYGSPAFAARGMEITPGWETVELTMDPSGLRRGAHRRVAARPGAAHHAGADHRRRARRPAATRSRSSTATPTARPTAGAPSPAARW